MSEQFIRALDGGLYNFRGVKRILVVSDSNKADYGIIGHFEDWNILIDLGGIYTSVFKAETREACEEELRLISGSASFLVSTIGGRRA